MALSPCLNFSSVWMHVRIFVFIVGLSNLTYGLISHIGCAFSSVTLYMCVQLSQCYAYAYYVLANLSTFPVVTHRNSYPVSAMTKKSPLPLLRSIAQQRWRARECRARVCLSCCTFIQLTCCNIGSGIEIPQASLAWTCGLRWPGYISFLVCIFYRIHRASARSGEHVNGNNV